MSLRISAMSVFALPHSGMFMQMESSMRSLISLHESRMVFSCWMSLRLYA